VRVVSNPTERITSLESASPFAASTRDVVTRLSPHTPKKVVVVVGRKTQKKKENQGQCVRDVSRWTHGQPFPSLLSSLAATT
jgi:hypothetical protein